MLEKPSTYWLVLANVSVGTFMATLDSGIVNVALPTIGVELRAEVTWLQWVITAYLVTISSLLLVFGRLSDIIGRKRIYTGGFITFTVGSALCGLSQGVWQLIAFRIVQGLGASMMMPNALALITQVFPAEKRGRALGISSMVVSIGLMTGPAVGGILVGALGWRSIFWLNVPLGVIGSLLAVKMLPSVVPAEKVKMDWTGAACFAAGINCLLFLSFQLPETGWTLSNIGLLLGALLFGLLFYLWENRVVSPLLDLKLFKNRIFAVGNSARLLVFLAQYPVLFLMPFYLQLVKGLSPGKVGLIVMCVSIAMAVFAPLSGRAADRFSPGIVARLGPLVLAVGLGLLATLDSSSSLVFVCIALLFVGSGMGIFQAPNNSIVMGSVEKEKLSITNAVVSITRNIGTILGIAMSVIVFTVFSGSSEMTLSGDAAGYIKPDMIISVTTVTFSISMVILILTFIYLWYGYSSN